MQISPPEPEGESVHRCRSTIRCTQCSDGGDGIRAEHVHRCVLWKGHGRAKLSRLHRHTDSFGMTWWPEP